MTIRTIFFSTLVLVCSGAAMAQRPSPEFWQKVGCEPVEPRTRLEALEGHHSTIIIRGFTLINTVEVPGINIFAMEMREARSPGSRAKGIVVSLREGSDRPNENRALIDYDEINPLLNAIDTISRVDETATKLTGFDARYRTLGDLEIIVFRQTRSGTAVSMRMGICNRTTVNFSLDELAKVRAMFLEAKTRLDDIK